MKIYRKLVAEFGTQQKTAEALGVDQSAVSCWVRGIYRMSARPALKAERITSGKFKAADLCPELDIGDSAA